MYKNREFNINLRSKGRLAAFEKYTPGICIALALILAALVTGWVCSRAEMISRAELQEHLADEVLRFHVLANRRIRPRSWRSGMRCSIIWRRRCRRIRMKKKPSGGSGGMWMRSGR